MELRSGAFDRNGTIPKKYTCDGEDISPPLFWSQGPERTRSYMVICEDPDAPSGVFKHWGVYNIPADETSLVEDIPPRTEDSGIMQAENDFQNVGYGGPCPPKADGAHHYHFKVFALKVRELEFEHTPDVDDLLKMARPHIAADSELIGLYERE